MADLKTFELGNDFTAKTFAGLEQLLAEELKEIGALDVTIIKRGVTFKGDQELLYKANYCCKTALRFLKPIGVFEVKDDEQLYAKVTSINWLDVFDISQTFIVNAHVFYSNLDHSHFVALRTKDAIVDQFREKTGKRPWVGKDKSDIYIDVHISHDVCTISLDSSGESLHKRGYRIDADKAPINEVLAAGMIKLTGWKDDKDFYDPMCGSGTIPIEAAMQAMKIPAGYYRKHYAFMSWAGYDLELWNKIKEEVDMEMGEMECEIFASDRSRKAVAIARGNLKNAGLHKDIELEVKYFDAIKPKEKKGILVFNPPYGKRLEEKGEIIDLYKNIGNTLKQDFIGFEAWVICANFDSAKFIGLRPSAKITLFNGPIETKFLKFEMYEGTKRYGDDQDRNQERRGKGGYKGQGQKRDFRGRRNNERGNRGFRRDHK